LNQGLLFRWVPDLVLNEDSETGRGMLVGW